MYRSFLLFLVAVLGFSCTTSGSSSLDEIDINIKSASKGDEIIPVAKKAFGSAFSLEDIEVSVKELLQKHPENGELNEIAAFISILKSENGKAFEHLIKATLDSDSKNIQLILEMIFSMNLAANERKVFIRTLETLA
ncbi:MAG TPA: hypothetical protein VLJ60_04360, partial [bacterium]|nr:hypothetical protein [bacterium]